MTGQDFQDKLDALVADMQTNGKGQTAQLLLRDSDNVASTFSISCESDGEVSAANVAAVQSFINPLKTIADTYESERAPVTTALEAFKTAQAPHQALMDAATAARIALQTALESDSDYQTAKTALDNARADAGYIAAVEAYRVNNVSENFGNLGDAKGKYHDT